MRKVLLIFLFGMLFVAGCESVESDSGTEFIGGVPVLRIETTQEDYISLLENKTTDFEIPCKIRYKNQVLNGEIGAAGAGSRYHDKWGYKIALQSNEIIEGLNKFNLSSQIYDKTGLSTAIAVKYYAKCGFPAHKSYFVFLIINGEEKGLYPLNERVEEPFFENRNLTITELYKLGFETKFTFSNVYIPEFNIEKKIPKDNNYNSLIEFINALDTCNITSSLAGLNKYLDVNNYIKYHALTTILNNQDAYTNNFFLAKEYASSPFKAIPWDFDKAFIGDVGLYGENEIIQKLKSSPLTKKMYLDEVKYQLENIFTLSEVSTYIDSLSIIISEAYKRDPYLGKNRYNFATEVNNLKNYITNRRQELLNKIAAEN